MADWVIELNPFMRVHRGLNGMGCDDITKVKQDIKSSYQS
jgi:hypothetical protein